MWLEWSSNFTQALPISQAKRKTHCLYSSCWVGGENSRCVCVHPSTRVDVSITNGCLVGWFSVNQTICGSVKYISFTVFLLKLLFQSFFFFFFNFLATVWHFSFAKLFLIRRPPQVLILYVNKWSPSVMSDDEYSDTVLWVLISLLLLVFMSQYYLCLGYFPRLALINTQLY